MQCESISETSSVYTSSDPSCCHDDCHEIFVRCVTLTIVLLFVLDTSHFNKQKKTNFTHFNSSASVTRANIKFLRRRSPWISGTKFNDLTLFFKCNVHKLNSASDVSRHQMKVSQ